jgi:hypothetical protein
VTLQALAPRLLLITSDWPPPGKSVRLRAELLQAAGVQVEVFAHRGSNPFNYLAAWTALRPRLHRGRYDVVHAHNAANVLLAVPKRVPVVLTLVASDRPRLRTWLLSRLADAVIVTSEEMSGRVPRRVPVHVIPADLDEMSHTTRLVAVYRSVIRN